MLYGLCLVALNSLVGNKVLPARPFQTFHSVETVFKKNEHIFLPKHAVSPLGSLMPAVHQEVVRQGQAPVPGVWVVQGPPARCRAAREAQARQGHSAGDPAPGALSDAAAEPLWAPPWCEGHVPSAIPSVPTWPLSCPRVQVKKQGPVRSATAHGLSALVQEPGHYRWTQTSEVLV